MSWIVCNLYPIATLLQTILGRAGIQIAHHVGGSYFAERGTAVQRSCLLSYMPSATNSHTCAKAPGSTSEASAFPQRLRTFHLCKAESECATCLFQWDKVRNQHTYCTRLYHHARNTQSFPNDLLPSTVAEATGRWRMLE